MVEQILKVRERDSLISRFLKRFKVVELLSKCGCHKERGISASLIMTSLLTLIFCGKNLWRSIETGSTALRKDTVYRFLNSVNIKWAMFLSLLAKKIYGFLRPLTSEDRADCFVLDDTLFDKSRSSKLELMAKVFDHETHRYCKGFRALTLGYTDGNSFLPLGFNLLSSAKENNRYAEMRSDLDKRTNGYKARKRALLPAPEAAIDLIINALCSGISAKYLLCDSWFATGKFFKSVLTLSLNVIATLKDMEHQYYLYHGKKLRLSQLYKELKPNNKQKFGKNIHFGTLTAAMASGDSYVNVTITFIETSGKKRDWIAIASTDTELSAAEITRIYGKRWSIEVFFKTVKSELGFAKEFQGRSFDMLVAHTTIVYVRYMILAVEARESVDGRTLGELFFMTMDELFDIRLDESLKIIISAMFDAAKVAYNPKPEDMRLFATAFLGSLPDNLRDRFTLLDCES